VTRVYRTCRGGGGVNSARHRREHPQTTHRLSRLRAVHHHSRRTRRADRVCGPL